MRTTILHSGRNLVIPLASLVLLTACSREPLEAPDTGTGSAPVMELRTAGEDFIKVDAAWWNQTRSDAVKFEVLDGGCNPLGVLYAEWNGSAYYTIRYDASLPGGGGFSVYDGVGNTVTFGWGTHNWLIASDASGGICEVLELDIDRFDPGSTPSSQTPLWVLSPIAGQPGFLGWSVVDNATHAPYHWSVTGKYESFPLPSTFYPC